MQRVYIVFIAGDVFEFVPSVCFHVKNPNPQLTVLRIVRGNKCKAVLRIGRVAYPIEIGV